MSEKFLLITPLAYRLLNGDSSSKCRHQYGMFERVNCGVDSVAVVIPYPVDQMSLAVAMPVCLHHLAGIIVSGVELIGRVPQEAIELAARKQHGRNLPKLTISKDTVVMRTITKHGITAEVPVIKNKMPVF